MDPKMDPGIESSGYCSVDEAIENGIAPVPLSFDQTVDVKRTLDVMDHLLACEVCSNMYLNFLCEITKLSVFNTSSIYRQHGTMVIH